MEKPLRVLIVRASSSQAHVDATHKAHTFTECSKTPASSPLKFHKPHEVHAATFVLELLGEVLSD